MIHLRLWGDAAEWSEVKQKREIKRLSREFGVEIEFEVMTTEKIQAMSVVEKKGKRGGVDGGTGKDAEEQE
jgi:hypothetical protein